MGILLYAIAILIMPATMFMICLIALDMDHTPVKLRPLKMRIDGFMDKIDEVFDGGKYDQESEEKRPIPPLHAAFLANPNQDIATLMAMTARADMLEEAQRPPKFTAPRLDPVDEYQMLQLEIQLHLNMVLTPKDHVLKLTRKEYRQLHEFCGFYFDDIRTPEQAFGRYGLLLQVS